MLKFGPFTVSFEKMFIHLKKERAVNKNVFYLPDTGVSTIDICMQAFRDIYQPNWTANLAQLLTIYAFYFNFFLISKLILN